MADVTGPITVLVVDNDPGFADLVAEMLQREAGSFDVETTTTAAAAIEAIETRDVECIVSDYDMPEMSGLELLETVRKRAQDLPFILYTGKGSEEVASEAIAAGVTGYLQKKPGRERYALLANQITNAVTQYRTETELRKSERRYERTLAALHETTRDLMRAGTKTEIYRSAIETAEEILDIPVVSAYAFDPTDGVLEHVTSTDSTWELLDPDVTFGRSEGLIWEAFSAGETAYYQDVRSESNVYNEQTLSRSEMIVPLGTHGVLLAGSETADGIDESTRELLHILSANTEAALDRAERESLLREHDRTLTQKNEELTRLNQTNEIVRGVNRGVTEASTRREIEATVCERITDADRYLFAWIASNGEDPPTPTAWSGIDATYVDRVRDDGDRAPEANMVREALEDERVVVSSNVLDDDGWDRRRTEALTYGFQTVLAVPLVDGERSYGALLVHATQPDAITEGEREVFEELGETIGHAIRSVERTRAMVTDSRLVLELECRDPRLLLNRLAALVDGDVTLEGMIDRDGEDVIFFVAVDTQPWGELEAEIREWATVETSSIVSEGEERMLLELTTPSNPFVDILREYNVSLVGATVVDGTATLTIEASPRVDVRSVIERIRRTYPETELIARHERSTLPSGGGFDAVLEAHLTDKQREALEAAQYSGFFEWPRESTGEELAAALDVTPPTFHYHLRAAERKLVGLALGDLIN